MIGRARVGEGGFVAVVLLALTAFLVAPVSLLILQAFSADEGGFTLGGVQRYLATPGLTRSLINTALLASGVVVLVLPAAFGAAYALERTRLPFKATLQAVFSAPLLIPSLLPALALVYLFGRQGLLTPLFGGRTIYGAQGVLIADAIAAFPHALIILRTALSAADGRLYEQAALLGSGRWRTFWRITLPNVRHGLVSAAVVVFSLTIADIGAPKVVGGDFDVLALDIYKAVLGRQDFQLGAAAALFLLAPSVVAVVIERLAARRQAALVSARSTPFEPKRNVARDTGLGVLCGLIGFVIIAVFGVCQWAALVRAWPYDLSLSLDQYRLDRFDGGGWSALIDSILLGLTTAVLGTVAGFAGAYAAERSRADKALRGTVSAVALAPAAVPGLALGLAYVLFFNDPANPMHVIYGTFALLVVATVIHFYTVAHLTCVAALRALDPEFEAAGAVLGKSRLALVAQVIAPLSAPALVEVAVYLFLGAMTTVSAVVFLYPPDVKLVAVAVLNMDDAGDTAPAAAMGMLIVYVNIVVRLGGLWLRAHLTRRTGLVPA
ncbi:MAG: putative 2-aminoethylphosphonate ABC transporter permease subunit [Caulobacteraceae bacterium]